MLTKTFTEETLYMAYKKLIQVYEFLPSTWEPEIKAMQDVFTILGYEVEPRVPKYTKQKSATRKIIPPRQHHIELLQLIAKGGHNTRYMLLKHLRAIYPKAPLYDSNVRKRLDFLLKRKLIHIQPSERLRGGGSGKLCAIYRITKAGRNLLKEHK